MERAWILTNLSMTSAMVKGIFAFHHHQHREQDSCLKTRGWLVKRDGGSHRHVHRAEIHWGELQAVMSGSESPWSANVCKQNKLLGEVASISYSYPGLLRFWPLQKQDIEWERPTVWATGLLLQSYSLLFTLLWSSQPPFWGNATEVKSRNHWLPGKTSEYLFQTTNTVGGSKVWEDEMRRICGEVLNFQRPEQ